MRSRYSVRSCLLAVVIGLAGLLAGCNNREIAGGVGSFIAGLLIGGIGTSSTTVTCYQNGVLIACASLHPDILQ